MDLRVMLVLMISMTYLVELEDTFSKVHSLGEPFVVDFSEVTPLEEGVY